MSNDKSAPLLSVPVAEDLTANMYRTNFGTVRTLNGDVEDGATTREAKTAGNARWCGIAVLVTLFIASAALYIYERCGNKFDGAQISDGKYDGNYSGDVALHEGMKKNTEVLAIVIMALSGLMLTLCAVKTIIDGCPNRQSPSFSA